MGGAGAAGGGRLRRAAMACGRRSGSNLRGSASRSVGRTERIPGGPVSWMLVSVGGKPRRVAIVRSGGAALVSWGGVAQRVASEPAAAAAASGQKERDIRAPMTGRVVKVAASPGAAVRARETLIVLEAM